MYNWIIFLMGVLLVLRGLWGIFSYILGRGAKFHHFPGYEKLKQNNPNMPWFVKYGLWNSMLFWVGTKDGASKGERAYLLFGSVMQLIAGALMLYVYTNILLLGISWRQIFN